MTWKADPLVWDHGPISFEVFLEPTCPFSVRAFGKLRDFLDYAVSVIEFRFTGWLRNVRSGKFHVYGQHMVQPENSVSSALLQFTRSSGLGAAFYTHILSVCAEQPILAAIEQTIAQREGCSASCSATIRTARARTSGENLFVDLLVIDPTSHELGSPANPGRFSCPVKHRWHERHVIVKKPDNLQPRPSDDRAQSTLKQL